MKNEEIKNRLLQAAKQLLKEADQPETITARQIAAQANANLALINYHYKSKDDLINQAIGEIVQNTADRWKDMMDDSLPPKEKLEKMLIALSDMVMKYSKFTKISIQYELTKNQISLPYYLIPTLKEYFQDGKSETELKIIAYEIVSFLQLIFLRAEEFQKYTGENIQIKETRDKLIRMQISIFLGGKHHAI